MAATSHRYIETRGSKFRVRLPETILAKRWLGTYDTIDDALAARDAFLEHHSSMNRSLPDVATPRQAWNATPLQLDLPDIWLYCADMHAPAYSKQMVERLLAVGRHYGVKRLVIGGDLMDQATVSKWPNITPQHSLSETQDATGELLVTLADVFEEIVVFSGNHDQRVAKKLGNHISLESLLWSCIKGRPFKAKLIASDFTFAYFGDEGNGGPDTGIVAGHPAFFSQVAAKSLADVAMIQHRHVLGSHIHAAGQLWSRCGRYWAIDPGCMLDPANTPYIQLGIGISKFPQWKQGFVLMRKSIPLLMCDGWVDWSEHGVD